jgi:O-antigen/teichoic acid export membrane protein
MNVRSILRETRDDLLSTAIQSSDPAQRSVVRHRRAAATAITSAASRAVRVGVSLVTIPLTLHYLGDERFGLWMTISSVVAMAGFADFGIGNGVLNAVSTAFGKDDLAGIQRAISSGIAILTVIGGMVVTLFLLIYPRVDWGSVFHASTTAGRADAGPATMAFIICFALNIPLDVVQRAQLGLQQGFLTNLWQIASNFMALAGILTVIHFHLTLTALVVAFAGTPVLGTAMNVGYFFGVSRRDLLPRWHFLSPETISTIAKLGGLFFILQLVMAVSYSADNFIIARVLDVRSVTVFSIPQRMFSAVTILITMLAMPLWPAYGEAISRGDMPWVRQTLVRSLIGVFAFATIASAILISFSNKLILWWVGPDIRPPFLLMLGLAVWTVLGNCGSVLAMFLNGAGIIKFQVIVAAIFGVGCLVTKVFLTQLYGITGVPWATIITYGLLSALPCALYVPSVLKRMEAGVLQPSVLGVEED